MYFVRCQVIIFQGRQDLAVSYNNDTQNFQTQTNFEHIHIIPIKKFCLAKQTFTTRSRRTKAGMSLSSSLPFLPPSGRCYLQNHLSLPPSFLAWTLNCTYYLPTKLLLNPCNNPQASHGRWAHLLADLLQNIRLLPAQALCMHSS